MVKVGRSIATRMYGLEAPKTLVFLKMALAAATPCLPLLPASPPTQLKRTPKTVDPTTSRVMSPKAAETSTLLPLSAATASRSASSSAVLPIKGAKVAMVSTLWKTEIILNNVAEPSSRKGKVSQKGGGGLSGFQASNLSLSLFVSLSHLLECAVDRMPFQYWSLAASMPCCCRSRRVWLTTFIMFSLALGRLVKALNCRSVMARNMSTSVTTRMTLLPRKHLNTPP
mmetsp:Transcript_23902/g.51252  ORF Transcript_23902/g.51252 Transcript_23902/m.51252 type:complete len:227 (-) Transcript_23902:318-998(-)